MVQDLRVTCQGLELFRRDARTVDGEGSRGPIPVTACKSSSGCSGAFFFQATVSNLVVDNEFHEPNRTIASEDCRNAACDKLASVPLFDRGASIDSDESVRPQTDRLERYILLGSAVT